MTKILIAGARGMLGSDLVTTLGRIDPVQGLGRQELDVSREQDWTRWIRDFDPDVVINAAAMTDVDGCEANPEQAYRINRDGCKNLVRAVASTGARVIHFSTDYVFDGRSPEPYREEDPPGPLNVYGQSKLEGEEWIRAHCPRHLILRTSWLFGSRGKNFIRTMVLAARSKQPLQVVHDQRGSPTYTRDLARYTLEMMQRGCSGTYHLTNRGSCSWYELAVRSIREAGIENVSVTPVTTREYPRPAPRPANSVLANARLEQEGLFEPRSWMSAVSDYVHEFLGEATGAGRQE